MSTTVEERFWLDVGRGAEDECWPWLGKKHYDGYGAIGGRRAHRVSFQIHRGEIPSGYHVHHVCGRKDCVNPAHLNVISPGLHSSFHKRGEKNGRAKLTRSDVAEIRRLKGIVPQWKLGERFGVSQKMVSFIHRGELWKR